jgi:hypothetical protein
MKTFEILLRILLALISLTAIVVLVAGIFTNAEFEGLLRIFALLGATFGWLAFLGLVLEDR